MIENIQNSITNVFGENPLLATFIIALLPIFELRGAIPFGMSTHIWGTQALTSIQAFLISFLATSLIIPLIALVFIPLLNTLKKTKTFKNISEKIFNHFNKKANSVNKNEDKSKWYKMLGVMGFVAVPLPLTGVYTGTVIAVLIGLNFYETLFACVTGNLIAGIIITLLSTVLKDKSIYLLFAFIAILVITIIVSLIKKLVLKFKAKHKLINNE